MNAVMLGLRQRAVVSKFRFMGRQHRRYSDNAPKPRSAHSEWYSDVVPAMIPIFLLGSAVYLGLQLTQLKLSHEKALEEALQRVKALESELEAVEKEHANRRSQPQPTQAQSSSEEKPKKSSWW